MDNKKLIKNGFIPELCYNYIEKNKDYKKEIKYILYNTIYIKKNKMLFDFNQILNNWILWRNNIKKLGIVLEYIGTTTSQIWMYYENIDIFPEHKIINPMSQKLDMKDVDEILIFDDFNFSCKNNIINQLFWLTYNNDCNHLGLNILVPYCSNDLITELNCEENDVAIKFNGGFYFGRLLSLRNLDNLQEKFFQKYNSIQSEKCVAFHTEYEYPRKNGSFANIYNECRTCPDREFFKNIPTNFLKIN